MSITRWNDEHVEGLVLGDSPIVVFGHDGGVDILRDGRHAAIVAELRRDAANDRGLHGRDGDELHKLIQATRPAKLARMNRPGGYWVAEATREAGQHAIIRRWPTNDTHALLAVTDGVSCGIDDYGVPSSWPAALNLAVSEGLDALLAVVHQAEIADPRGKRWPRSKTHDDKAAALLFFPGEHLTTEDVG